MQQILFEFAVGDVERSMLVNSAFPEKIVGNTDLQKYENELNYDFIKAWEFRPIRLEALYHLIKFLGSKKRYGSALAFATLAMRTPTCRDVLFVEEEIWTWRMPDEYAVLSYYNGNPEEAYKTTKMVMDSPVFASIPEKDRERMEKNMEFTCEDIAQMIDHSLLRPELTDEDIAKGCECGLRQWLYGQAISHRSCPTGAHG